MKIRKTFIIKLLLLGFFVACLLAYNHSNALAADEKQLKEACIQATVQAITMEIKNYEIKLEAAQNGPGDSSRIQVLKDQIKELQAERAKYHAMNPDNYTLPEKKMVSVTVSRKYQVGSILELDNLTKSGPFYHLAGIRGDDYNALQIGRQYTLTIYLVYKKDYVLPSAINFYVYVDSYNIPYSLSPRQTGEEILEELIVKPNMISIRVGSNGGTDKNSFRVEVKKEDGITEKAPHYVLTFYRIIPDECKAIVDEGALITFNLEKDLGIKGVYTLSILNRIYSKSKQ